MKPIPTANLTTIGLVAALSTVVLSGTFAQSQRGASAQWEYAELVVQGDRVILIQQDFYDVFNAPSRVDPGGRSGPTNGGRRHWKTSVAVTQLNRVGLEGWEIYASHALQNGEKYLLRRFR